MNNSKPINPETVKMTPHNAQVEEALLGSVLIDPDDVLSKCRKLLTGSDFFIIRNGWVWDACCSLHDRGEHIDLLTLADEMGDNLAEFGGMPAITYLMSITPTAMHAHTYAKIIKDCAIKRRVLELMSSVAEQSYDGTDSDEVLDTLINSAAMIKIAAFKSSGKLAAPRSLAELGPKLPPIEFLWHDWIPRGMISLLGASPGAGKSFVALDLCKRIIAGLPFPDGSEQLTPGDTCIYVDAEVVPQIAYERASNWEMDMSKLFMMLPHTDDALDFSSDQYRAELHNMAECLKPALIVIDSLSSISSKGENNVEDVRQILSFLNGLATRHRCAVLLIHHLRKRNPLAMMDLVTIDDFRGSGHIIAMSRSVLALSIIQVGPDPDRNGPRRLEVIKTNLNRYPEALGVNFLPLHPKGVLLDYADPPSKWREPTELDKCVQWLLASLTSGPMSPAELIEDGQLEGYSRVTIYRAREKSSGRIVNTEGRQSPTNKWKLP